MNAEMRQDPIFRELHSSTSSHRSQEASATCPRTASVSQRTFPPSGLTPRASPPTKIP
jgi:hypothetical protein